MDHDSSDRLAAGASKLVLRWLDPKNPLAVDFLEILMDIGFDSAAKLSFVGSLTAEMSLHQAFQYRC